MRIHYNLQIAVGAVAGILIGVAVNAQMLPEAMTGPILYVSDLIGKGIFVNLLKMILIPLVFTSIVIGIANLRAHAQMDRVWKYTLIYFFSTTALAVLLGLTVVNIFRPGDGLQIDMFADLAAPNFGQSMTVAQFLKMFIANLFLNPFQAMAQGEILPVIIFALMLGIALIKIGDERAQTLLNFFDEFFQVIMLMVQWIMKILPFGLCALLIGLVATQDVQVLGTLAKFMLVVIGATLFHGIVTLPALLWGITRRSPLVFFAGMKNALITAFSTSSSSATLPITMKSVENNLKVDKDVSGFVLPLGATMNMDGTALYEAVAAIFVAHLSGIELNILQQLIVFITAIIAAIGAPGIPSAGMVTMVMVLQSVNLPVEAIAILLPIDRLLDALRTTVNVEGDAIGSCVVDHWTSRAARQSPPNQS